MSAAKADPVIAKAASIPRANFFILSSPLSKKIEYFRLHFTAIWLPVLCRGRHSHVEDSASKVPECGICGASFAGADCGVKPSEIGNCSRTGDNGSRRIFLQTA